jgi:type VI secretion system secreted protein Hcp
MAFDTFLDLGDKIKGESTAKGFEGKIEIFSFSWGASAPVTIGSGSGGVSGGKVSISSFNVMKKTDKASALCFLACCTGDHIEKVIVTMRKAGGTAGQLPFLKYTFTTCMVESIQWSGSTGGDDSPTESMSLAFGKCEIEYSMQDKTGKMSVAGQAAFDLTTVST